jgi:hypothetical protein
MHDQLILTGGSDAHVNLQSAITVSSAAFGSGDPEEDASDWSSDEEAALTMNNPAVTATSPNTLQLPITLPLGAVPLSRRSSSR